MSFLDDAAKSMAKALYEDFYRGMVGGAVAASVPASPQIGAAVQDVAANNIPSAAQAAATAAAAYAAPTPEELLKSITSAASSNDASATGTVTPSTISPITNQPSGAVGGSPSGSMTGYSIQNYQSDFAGNPNTNTLPQISQLLDKYGNVYVGKTVNGVPHKIAILGDPSNTNAYRISDIETAYKDILMPYISKKGGITALKQAMWQKGQFANQNGKASIAAGDKIDDTFNKVLIKYIDELTSSNFTNSDTRSFLSFGKMLSDTRNFAGTKTSTSTTLTLKDIAAQDIASFVQQYLGRGATAEEVSSYQKALNAYERAHPTKATVTTDALGTERNRVQTSAVSEQDKAALKVAVVSKALQAQGVDPLSISKTGGIVAQGMDAIKETAAKYGMAMDDKMALNEVMQTLQPGGDLKQRAEIIKQNSKLMYKNLASYIDQGGSVKSIADNYNYYKKKYLETGAETDVFDKDIQKALHNDGKAGVMNLNEFIVLLKQKPEWAKTMNAHEEAADYANTVLKSFGLVG
jgi:hypothetical protein